MDEGRVEGRVEGSGVKAMMQGGTETRKSAAIPDSGRGESPKDVRSSLTAVVSTSQAAVPEAGCQPEIG